MANGEKIYTAHVYDDAGNEERSFIVYEGDKSELEDSLPEGWTVEFEEEK
jgi:hypothetical protein